MTEARPVRRLPRLRDLNETTQIAMEAAVETCRRLFTLRGYERLETPCLEETELFLRKSGGELSSRLYSFIDPGGYAVSLRPEYTAPVLRHLVEAGPDHLLPARYQYSGPVFRYAIPGIQDETEPRQFIQCGAELIGVRSPEGDGEILATAHEGLNALGVPAAQLVVGHVGLLWELLAPYSLSERARLFLINNVGSIREGTESVRRRALDLGLLPESEDGTGLVVASAEQGLTLDLVERVLESTLQNPASLPFGTRSPSEVTARLARKMTMADDPVSVENALSLLEELSILRAPAFSAIEQGRAVARRHNVDPAAFHLLESVTIAALDEGVPETALAVDLGLARGIAYYTGMVFDMVSGPDGGASLGGGGRYDGLPRALGASSDIPALGFAYNLDAVWDAVPGPDAEQPKPRILVRPAGREAAQAARMHAARLRTEGNIAIVDLSEEAGAVQLPPPGPGRTKRIDVVAADGTVESEAVR